MKNLLIAVFLAFALMALSAVIFSTNERLKIKKTQRDLKLAQVVYCDKDTEKNARKVALNYIKRTLPLVPKNWICP